MTFTMALGALPRTAFVVLLAVLVSAPVSRARARRPWLAQPQGSAPSVEKVDPPSWWAGSTVIPVRLLIKGHNLGGATVAAVGRGLRILSPVPQTSANGDYLFVDLTLEGNPRPGPHLIRITTAAGSTEARFDVLAPLSRAGRFQGFSPDDLVYLIMVDRFSDGDPSSDDPAISRGLFDRSKPHYYHGGDFQGIINHLPYLKDLGITAIWITPVYDNVNHLNEREKADGQPVTDYHGYGAVDFYKVEEHFGDLRKLRELVDDAHGLGIKVIQDEVANHTGPYHPWVDDPPTPTWFHGSASHHLNETWQTWTLIDPHATREIRRSTLDGWFADILPDLNQDDPEVERYLIQNTLWWLGVAGFDGIREDTLPYVPRRFWRDWMAAIKREYPKATVVGEVFDGDPALTSFFQGGRERRDGIDSGVDAVFDFPLYFKMRDVFAGGQPIRVLAQMIGHDVLYPHPRLLGTFIGNHDTRRFMSEPGATPAALKLADAFLLTARGFPTIYYGDEIGLAGGNDPDNRRDFPGGWAGDPENAFLASGRTAEEQSVFEYVSRLGHLRAQLEPLRRGSMVDLAVTDQAYAYARMIGREAVVVVLNSSDATAGLEFNVAPVGIEEGATLLDQLGSAPEAEVKNGQIQVTLPPRTAAIYTVRRPR